MRAGLVRDVAIGVLCVAIAATLGWVVGTPAHGQAAPEDASALLDAAMAASGDPTTTDLKAQANVFASTFGLAPTDAGLLVVSLWFGLKLLDVSKGVFEALGLWTRKKLVGDLVPPNEKSPGE